MGTARQCLTQGFRRSVQGAGVILLLATAVAFPAGAQLHGQPASVTVGRHFLAPAPSVTSLAGRHLPPPAPSVTSIPNFGYQYHGSHFNKGSYRGRGYRGGGYGYSLPYYYPYYPVGDSAYGYDYVGNGSPDLYSGPPLGPNDQTQHIVVEQPPARPYTQNLPEPEAYATPKPPAPAPAAQYEVKPGEPIVLVFRIGRQQEVTNYAIMGDTLYVFDQSRRKIALAELDIPATVKANDDRGMEFRVPPTPKKKPAMTITVPQSASPDDTKAPNTPNIAAARP